MRASRHPYTWGRRHPLVFDGLIAALVTVAGVLTELAPDGHQYSEHLTDADVFSLAVSLGGTLPLVLRRRQPFRVFLVAYGATWLLGMGGYSGAGPWVAMLFGLYAVACYDKRRGVAIGCLAAALALGVLSVLSVPYEMEVSEIVIGSLGMPLAAWLLGDNVRIRRAYVEAVEDRAAHLEREQDAQARRAVVEERNRIARELHDIVAHSMSVMVVQAGAARRTLGRDPERATEAIGQIEATGRGALQEMRRLVGVLRNGDNDEGPASDRHAQLLPQPGLEQIPALVGQWSELGMDVTFHIKGRERQLPPGMELVLYRIVQEALTNVAKHAGPAASAEATLTYKSRAVTLAVVDDGRGASAAVAEDASGRGLVVVKDLGALRGRRIVRVAEAGTQVAGPSAAGHGMVGMAERVALYDGEMRWGPRRGGGFQVWVKLPLPGPGPGDGPDAEARPVESPAGAT